MGACGWALASLAAPRRRTPKHALAKRRSRPIVRAPQAAGVAAADTPSHFPTPPPPLPHAPSSATAATAQANAAATASNTRRLLHLLLATSGDSGRRAARHPAPCCQHHRGAFGQKQALSLAHTRVCAVNSPELLFFALSISLCSNSPRIFGCLRRAFCHALPPR